MRCRHQGMALRRLIYKVNRLPMDHSTMASNMAGRGAIYCTLGLAGLVALAWGPPGAAALDDEMAELARMVRENCAAETAVDMALLAKVDGGADLMPDEKLKCYIKCTMETAGMMGDGEVDVEAVLALLPDELRHKNEGMLRQCGTQKGADHCDTAYLTQVCWQKGSKADYMLI